jgi:hypothetical protein
MPELRRWAARTRLRASRWLVVGLGGVLVGCGSSDLTNHGLAGIEAARRDTVANLEAGRYTKACEDFTAAARIRLLVFPMGGCPGALAFARGFLAVDGRTRLGVQFERQLRQVIPHLTVEGEIARVGSVVEARYEQGRWRFEGRREPVPGAPGNVRGDLEATMARLRRDGMGQLLGRSESP